MAQTIGEAADEYQPSTKTMNIADLDRVSIDLQIVEDTFEFTKGDETKTVTQEVIVIEDVKYRIPVTVKQQLKVLMEDNPKLKFFKVKKSGTTKDDTRYQVIPLME